MTKKEKYELFVKEGFSWEATLEWDFHSSWHTGRRFKLINKETGEVAGYASSMEMLDDVAKQYLDKLFEKIVLLSE